MTTDTHIEAMRLADGETTLYVLKRAMQTLCDNIKRRQGAEQVREGIQRAMLDLQTVHMALHSAATGCPLDPSNPSASSTRGDEAKGEAVRYCVNCDSPMPKGCEGTFTGDEHCPLSNSDAPTSDMPPMSPDGDGPLYAPAQEAADERDRLRVENEQLRAKLQEQALQYLSDNGQWIEQVEALRKERDDARDVATGKVKHVFNGLCPDEIEGPFVRDAACPACRMLGAALLDDGGTK